MIAQDIMTPDPIALSVTATVREAVDTMMEADIRHLPIVSEGTLQGMVSDRDLRSYTLPLVEAVTAEGGEDRHSLPIGDLMQGGVISVEREASLRDIIDLMVEHRVGAVPVVDTKDDRLVGIISYVDVLRVVSEQIL